MCSYSSVGLGEARLKAVAPVAAAGLPDMTDSYLGTGGSPDLIG